MSLCNNVLVPVDLMDDAPSWVHYAVAMAQAMGADVTLVHVVDYVPTMFPVEMPPGYPVPQLEVVEDAAMKRLKAMAGRLKDVKVTPVVLVGAAADEIIRYAEANGVDHIVVASHTRGAFARLVLGSVAERISRTAKCPVTIVRAED